MNSNSTPKRKRLPGLILSALVLSILAACGGGGGGDSGSAPPPVTGPVVPPVLPPVTPSTDPVVPPIVSGSTSITTQPQSQSVTLAAVSSFSVNTSGAAPLGYQWLRNGTPIAGATASTYSPPPAQAMDNGAVLRAIVRTSEGHLESAPAVITVPGAGMRMFAGALERERTFDPIFDARIEVDGLAADAAGNVLSLRGANLHSLSQAGAWTLLATESCAPSTGVAVDKAGTMYLGCGSALLKRTAGGVFTVFAGSRTAGGNVDGAASAARFSTISAITVGADSVAYVADAGNGTIRRIAPDGAVTTLAGSARNGTAVDGAGSAAKFIEMRGVAVDAQGNVFVTDRSAVRKVSSVGVVSTVAGNASATAAGWTDGAGSVARFGNLFGIAIDAAGQLYVADPYYHSIRKITPAGVVSTLAGSHDQFGSSNGFGRFASFNTPRWLAIDAGGNLIVSDYGSGTLRQVTAAGVVTTLRGTPGLERSSGGLNGFGQEARFRTPRGLAFDEAGNLLVADSLGHSVRKVSPAGTVSTVAGSVLVNGAADGGGAIASLRIPTLVAPAGNGVVYVFDSLDDIRTDLIRRIGADGAVTTVHVPRDPLSVTATGVPAIEFHKLLGADLKGNYYVTTMAVSASACPPGQFDATCMGSGRQTLRKIAPDGTAVAILNGHTPYPGTGKTMDAMFVTFRQVAIDAAGVLYMADMTNKTVLTVDTAGVVSIMAGTVRESGDIDGASTQARFSFPEGIVVDALGNAYVIDGDNSTVRKISPSGAVTTLAGTALKYGDPTGELPGRLSAVEGLAVDRNGTVFISQENAIIKIVQPAP